jgi:hypothetical protein
LSDQVLAALQDIRIRDKQWDSYLTSADWPNGTAAVHLAVFVEPFLRYILSGQKTIESRFSMHNRPPFGSVAANDLVLLKRSGGPVAGICRVERVWYYQLDSENRDEIRKTFGAAMCASDPEFWRSRETARFASLMRIAGVKAMSPLRVAKRDRRGWVVVNGRQARISWLDAPQP